MASQCHFEGQRDVTASGDDRRDQIIRTGTFWTSIAHIITAVIGSGVLSLAWSTAQLGWIAAPVSMVCFAIVTYISSALLSDCYIWPPGNRNYTYMDAVHQILGKKQKWLCGFFQYLSMFGTCITYVVTTGISMRAIRRSNCFHREGHGEPCAYGHTFYMLLFGIVQIFFSQIPDFHSMGGLSILATVMSFSYSLTGFALGLAKVIGNGCIKGSIDGVPTITAVQKVWNVSQALGDIAFAYPYSLILIEIQDTLRSPPAENQTMKKASRAAICITTIFYLCCGGFGYAAFGNQTPGNLLTGFGFYEPFWLVDFANVCIILHLLGGYQIYSQPMFGFVENFLADKYPGSAFVNKSYTVNFPLLRTFRINFLRFCFRTAYVSATTGIALLFPYFNEVLGVIGALNFWPLAIYFPVQMYFVRREIASWTRRWLVLQAFSILCLIVTLVALVGSFHGLINARLR